MTSHLVKAFFKVLKTTEGSKARLSEIRPNGSLGPVIETPIFMPVATRGSLRHVPQNEVFDLNPPILLTNTYHLLLQPGLKVLSQFGGLKNLTHHKGFYLSDSGGFQIFSLSDSRKITEEGACFKSFIDGALHMLTPESSLQIQRTIGSDIHMVLDVCLPSTSSHDESREAMLQTHRWAERSLKWHQENPAKSKIFGIVQGACFEDLRKESAEFLSQLDFDGLAIGGLAVGETKDQREHFTNFTTEFLPQHKPRYLMGVGTPIDLLEAVHRGVDMFDCILPTALAEQGVAYTRRGRMRLLRGVYAHQDRALDPDCNCSTCQKFSRAYIHHLIGAREAQGTQLIAVHNVHYYFDLMKDIRNSIREGTFLDFYKSNREIIGSNDIENPVQIPKISRKPGPPPFQLGEFSIHENKKGFWTLRHNPSGELFHGQGDPQFEAREIYAKSLENFINTNPNANCVVWDLGLGAAFNSMAALEVIKNNLSENPTSQTQFKMLSFDNSLDPLKLALKNIKYFSHLKSSGPADLAERGEWNSKCNRIQWSFFNLDLWKGLGQENPPIELSQLSKPQIIFFDAFSVYSQPEAWQKQVFTNLARLAGPKCELVTYTASEKIRGPLRESGWNCSHGPLNIFSRNSTRAQIESVF